LIGFAVVAAFLWMVPNAAAREAVSACRGMRGLEMLDRQIDRNGRVFAPEHGGSQLCPNGLSCQLPQPAPDFTAIDITGKPRKLSEFRGKVVMVNFWASWCGVCKAEKPGLTNMARELGSGDFVILNVVSDKTWSDAIIAIMESLAPGAPIPPRDANGQVPLPELSKAFEQALPNGIPFTPLLDPPAGDDTLGPITKAWGLTAVPESVLIDRQGLIRAYFVNKRDWESPVAQTCLRSVIDN
jgi:thiol-disulfide isomerase/thioredoxin